MSLRDIAPAPRPSVSLATLQDGDILVLDAGFPCLSPGYPHLVCVDDVGPWISCRCGRHYLDGQRDEAGMIVGMRRYR